MIFIIDLILYLKFLCFIPRDPPSTSALPKDGGPLEDLMLSDDVTKLYVHTIQIGPIKINVSFIISPHRYFQSFEYLLIPSCLLFSPTLPLSMTHLFALLLTYSSYYPFSHPPPSLTLSTNTWSHPPLWCHLPTHSASHSQRWGAQTQSAALLPGGGGSASKSQGLFSTFSIFLWRIGTPFIIAISDDNINHYAV